MANDMSSGEPLSTRDRILRATFHILEQDGYDALSVNRIANECGLTGSALYNHFDSKEELIFAFTEYLVFEMNREFNSQPKENPAADLYGRLYALISDNPDSEGEIDTISKLRVYYELRSKAIHNPELKTKITENANKYVREFEEIIQRGMAEGVFKDVDAEQEAAFLLTIIDGMITNVTTRTDDPRELIWDSVCSYIETQLIADGSAPDYSSMPIEK